MKCNNPGYVQQSALTALDVAPCHLAGKHKQLPEWWNFTARQLIKIQDDLQFTLKADQVTTFGFRPLELCFVALCIKISMQGGLFNNQIITTYKIQLHMVQKACPKRAFSSHHGLMQVLQKLKLELLPFQKSLSTLKKLHKKTSVTQNKTKMTFINYSRQYKPKLRTTSQGKMVQ